MSAYRRILVAFGALASLSFGVLQIRSGMSRLSGTETKSSTPAAVRAPALGDRVIAVGHGVSLKVPRGWIGQRTPSGGAMYATPPGSSPAANLIAMSEPYPESLRDYVDANIEAVKGVAPNARFESDTPFVPDSRATSHKVVLVNPSKDGILVQIMYFFDGPGDRKVVVTTTATAKDRALLEPLFDASLRSLLLVGPPTPASIPSASTKP